MAEWVHWLYIPKFSIRSIPLLMDVSVASISRLLSTVLQGTLGRTFFLNHVYLWIYAPIRHCGIIRLWCHRLQHARPPCASLFLGVCSNSSIESVMPSNHPILSSTFSFAFNLSQPQGLFQWVGSSYQVDKVLKLQLQPFQWLFRADYSLLDWLVWSPCCPRDSHSRIQKHQFFGTQQLWSNFTFILDCWKNKDRSLSQSDVSAL